MHRIRLFESNVNLADIENQIAAWAKEINPKIVRVDFAIHVMHDYYHDSAPPMFCNRWHEYTAAITYTI